MQRFVNFTLQQKVVFNLLFVLLMVIGAFTLLRMPVERYPNIQFGKMYILTYLPGASPEDIETLITREIEEALEDRLKASHFGVIMATHALELVRRHASEVNLIDDGRVVARFGRDQIRAAGDDLRTLLATRQDTDRAAGPV